MRKKRSSSLVAETITPRMLCALINSEIPKRMDSWAATVDAPPKVRTESPSFCSSLFRFEYQLPGRGGRIVKDSLVFIARPKARNISWKTENPHVFQSCRGFLGDGLPYFFLVDLQGVDSARATLPR